MIIRQFRPSDAEEVSRLIIQNLKEINAKYYPPEVIERLIDYYSPEKIIERSHRHLILIAEQSDESIIGTATFNDDANVFGSVFVHPKLQRQGIGTKLISRLEELIKESGRDKVLLHASLNAIDFYIKRGYTKGKLVNDEAFGKSYEVYKDLK